jgi:hypothetical protein
MNELVRPSAPALSFSVLALTAALAGSAFAPAASAAYSSHVSDRVVNNGNGSYTYHFTVHNDSTGLVFQNSWEEEMGYGGTVPVVIDWELPWFDDSNIANIQSAYGWSYEIAEIGVPNAATGWTGVANWQNPGDAWYQGPNSPFTTVSKVLHWYSIGGTAYGIFPEWWREIGYLDGFSFDSTYGPTGAPYQSSWAFLPLRTGDPAFPLTGGIPNSPMARGINPVPVPAPIVLLGSALVSLLGFSRRRTG